MSEQRVCVVCQRNALSPAEAQSCVACVGAVRRNLNAIELMHSTLPTELIKREGAASPMEPNGHIHGEGDPLPGGDIMVLLGPGSTRTHADPVDIDSVLGMLERWDTDWRITFRDAAAMDAATVSGCMVYLLRRLAHAAQHHPAFDEFASDFRDLRHSMEHILRRAPQRSPVSCFCGARALERPEPRQDGRRFEWQCSKCHRNYTQEEFWMAARQQGETEQSEVA